MFTLKIPAGLQPGCCALDEDIGRYAVHAALCWAVDGQTYVAATNGRCLSVLPVETKEPPPQPTLIHPKALDGYEKRRHWHEDAKVIVEAGESRRERGKRIDIHRLPQGKYPGLDKTLLPSAGTVAVVLKAEYLSQVAAAISGGYVLLLITPGEEGKAATKPVACVGLVDEKGPQGIGCVMPLDFKPEQLAAALSYYEKHRANVPTEEVKVG